MACTDVRDIQTSFQKFLRALDSFVTVASKETIEVPDVILQSSFHFFV